MKYYFVEEDGTLTNLLDDRLPKKINDNPYVQWHRENIRGAVMVLGEYIPTGQVVYVKSVHTNLAGKRLTEKEMVV